MQNVVVATDLTPVSDAAVDRAAFASGTMGAALHMVHVVPELLLPPYLGGSRVEKAEGTLRYRATVLSRRYRPRAISFNVAQGDTSRSIVRESEDTEAVLTVMGCRSDARNGRRLYGTIRERALHLIRNAALIVCDQSPKATRYRKVLLAPAGDLGTDALMPHLRHLAPDAAIHKIDLSNQGSGVPKTMHRTAEHVRAMRRALGADLLVIATPRDESLNPFRFRRLLTPLVRTPECDTLVIPPECDVVPAETADSEKEGGRIRIAS